jgi:PRC-barrel domain
MPNHPQPLSQLCYLDAANVNSPAGVLSELDVVTANGEQLGSIVGVVIEAAAGRARYFNIRSSGWLRRRHYLVEADQLAQVDSERKVLRLLSAEVREVQDLDTTVLRQFSDDDLVAAFFPSRAA